MRHFFLVGLVAALIWEIVQLLFSYGNGILFAAGVFTMLVAAATVMCHLFEAPLPTELGVASMFTVPLGFLAVAGLSDHFAVGSAALESAQIPDPRPTIPGTRSVYEQAFFQHLFTLPLPFIVAGIMRAFSYVRHRKS